MLNNIFKKQRYYFEGDGEMVIDMDPFAWHVGVPSV